MGNIIVGAIVLVVITSAGYSVYRSYKKGSGCGCGCDGCGSKDGCDK